MSRKSLEDFAGLLKGPMFQRGTALTPTLSRREGEQRRRFCPYAIALTETELCLLSWGILR